MVTREQMEQTLFKLDGSDTTADDVAAKLKAANCKGIRHAARTCPIAVYLNQVFPETSVMVGPTMMSFRSSEPDPQLIGLPISIMTFISKFDSGDYPQLEA